MSDAESRRVYLGLGSNMGDRGEALRDAVRRIGQREETAMLPCSSVYETDPWGDVPQDAYLNTVAEIRTSLQPEKLLQSLLDIERDMGRVREVKYGPRRIDIDILFFGETVLEGTEIIIPHPRIAERNFVLIPLEELRPELLHPVMQSTVAELRALCSDSGGISKTDIRLWPETATS